VPWNPAVLEQRIGRVHRLGQRQPVRVINFVAQGTIEEGMLQVIKFKKSLFTGVLDHGDKDVFLGGSRLTKFMEQVEAATTAIPEALLEDAEEGMREPSREFSEQPRGDRRGKRRRGQPGPMPMQVPPSAGGGMPTDDEEETAGRAAASGSGDPWSMLLQTGMALLQQFTSPANGATGKPAGVAGMASSLITKDERTGETYLKVPVAKPEMLDQAVRALGMFLESLRK